MATVKTYTAEELRRAKKAGFKLKKPKKPKASASLNVLENYVTRYNAWVTRIKEKAKEFNQKEADKKKKIAMKNTISKL